MSRPRLLLLDEPSMGLAPMLVSQIFAIVRDINAEGTTILLVEQNARMALSVAHRGYVIQTGQVVVAGTASDLQSNETVRKAYLGESWIAILVMGNPVLYPVPLYNHNSVGSKDFSPY